LDSKFIWIQSLFGFKVYLFKWSSILSSSSCDISGLLYHSLYWNNLVLWSLSYMELVSAFFRCFKLYFYFYFWSTLFFIKYVFDSFALLTIFYNIFSLLASKGFALYYKLSSYHLTKKYFWIKHQINQECYLSVFMLVIPAWVNCRLIFCFMVACLIVHLMLQ